MKNKNETSLSIGRLEFPISPLPSSASGLIFFFFSLQDSVLDARLLPIGMNFASLPVGHHEQEGEKFQVNVPATSCRWLEMSFCLHVCSTSTHSVGLQQTV